jgi:hypothetical protein
MFLRKSSTFFSKYFIPETVPSAILIKASIVVPEWSCCLLYESITVQMFSFIREQQLASAVW